MKQRPIRILTCALLAFCAPLVSVPSHGQDAKAPAAVSADEKEAIAAYTKLMKEGEKFAKENTPDPRNPGSAMELMDKMEKLIDSIKTEGLPKDLTTAFGGFKSSVKKMIAHVNKMPVPREMLGDQAKLQAWIGEQIAANPKFLEEFQEKMGTFQEEIAVISKEGDTNKEALDTAHKKYGIDVDLDAGKAGGKKAKPAAEKEADEEAEEASEEKKEAKPEKAMAKAEEE